MVLDGGERGWGSGQVGQQAYRRLLPCASLPRLSPAPFCLSSPAVGLYHLGSMCEYRRYTIRNNPAACLAPVVFILAPCKLFEPCRRAIKSPKGRRKNELAGSRQNKSLLCSILSPLFVLLLGPIVLAAMGDTEKEQDPAGRRPPPPLLPLALPVSVWVQPCLNQPQAKPGTRPLASAPSILSSQSPLLARPTIRIDTFGPLHCCSPCSSNLAAGGTREIFKFSRGRFLRAERQRVVRVRSSRSFSRRSVFAPPAPEAPTARLPPDQMILGSSASHLR